MVDRAPHYVVAPRLARAVVVVLIGGFSGLTLLSVLASAHSPLAAATAFAVLAAHVALLVSGLLGATRWWPWLLAAQVVLTYAPVAVWPRVTALWGMSAFLAGACLVRLRPPWSWLGYGLVTVVLLPLPWWYERSVRAVVYVALVIAAVGFLLYAMAWLHRLATDLPAVEARIGAIEAARERRRLLRDAHDLLGFRLSALVLKLELAHRGDAERAREELAEARTQARAALAEAHALTAEPPELSLATELATATALLSAAGIALRSPAGVADPLPRRVEVVLATVLREATTNVLRHSTARHCSIELPIDRGTARLVVTNDGAAALPDRAVHGTGLASLTERVESIGGTLTATVRDGEFTLDARVPARRRAAAGPATPVVPAVGLVVLVAMYALSFTFPTRVDAPFVLLALAFGAGLGYLCWPRRDGARPAAWRAVFAVLVLFAYLPLLHYPADAWAVRHYLGGAALLLLRGRARWLAAGAILAAEVALGIATHAPAASVAYHLSADLDDAAAMFALVQLPLLTGAFARAQARLAAAAVAQERTRFADQLGERLDERLHSVLRALATGDDLPAALDLARAAAADLREVARS